MGACESRGSPQAPAGGAPGEAAKPAPLAIVPPEAPKPAAAARPDAASPRTRLRRAKSTRRGQAPTSPLTRQVSLRGDFAAPPGSPNPNARRAMRSFEGSAAMPRADPLLQLAPMNFGPEESCMVKRMQVRVFTETPPGWDIHTDRASGRRFYYAPSLKESVFIPTAGAAGGGGGGGGGGALGAAPPSGRGRSGTGAGRRPRAPRAPRGPRREPLERGPVVPLGASTMLRELESGWQVMQDLTGQTYFRDPKTGELAWNAPATAKGI